MSREKDVLTSYGFEFKKRSWIDEESDGPGYWESATHKVVPHNDDRYSIVQFAQIVDYDDEAKIFHTEEMDCPSVCYWGMIDWEDEDFCDKLLTMLGAIIEIDHGFDDVFGEDEE